MSKAWENGSTPAWRRMRLFVLTRDGWMCQLCGEPIDPHLRHPDPRSASVHHVLGRLVSGDDPKHLVSAHRECNAKAGEPRRNAPDHKRVSKW